MDSETHLHRRSRTTPQSIPLQDLNRPPEQDEAPSDPQSHRRTLSDRGRRLLERGPSIRQSARYSRLRGDTDDPRSSIRPVLKPSRSDSSNDDQDGGLSPGVDAHQFQEAMGFAGLSFPTSDDSREALEARSVPGGSERLHNILESNDSRLSLEDVSLPATREDSDSPTTESDRTPLTDAQNSESHLTPSHPSGQRHDRRSIHSVKFSNPQRPSRMSRLGADLAAAESGTLSPHRARGNSLGRSLSPSSAESPLQRASTVVRKMSQRVVNLTNEPELVENELRRRSSRKARASEEYSESFEYNHDGARSPLEKTPSQESQQERPQLPHSSDWVRYANPLRGNSLGIFPPESKVRTSICDFLVLPFIEPFILALIIVQTVLLAVQAAPSEFTHPQAQKLNDPIDYTLLALYIIYTIEIAMRIVVSGFIVNPVEYSTINRQIGMRAAISAKAHSLFALQRDQSAKHLKSDDSPHMPSIFRTFTSAPGQASFATDGRQAQRIRLAHRAFLRHSFNRLDFVAVISYWISIGLSVTGIGSTQHIHAFAMLSTLRILRLLSLTSGTSVILRSLKKAAPLLLNVALLIGFFWLLFAIVGVQSFKSSLRRNCVWVNTDPLTPQPNYTTNTLDEFQFCGGSLDAQGNRHPWAYLDGTSSGDTKGYLCPPGSYCVSGQNPYNGTVSFDNVAQAMEQVFVVMTSNTYTDIMYYLTDSDYLIAALYFAVGIVILTFWMMNLLIAVITSSFQVIREESKTSAFGTGESETEMVEEPQPVRVNSAKRVFDKTYLLWIAVIMFGIICQCLRSAQMSTSREKFINISETVVTFILFGEIVARFFVDWRNFHKSRRNWVDLSLAIITMIIQIPPIHSSGQPYAWLTIFQILRVYRVVLAVPVTRELILLVLGTVSGLLNLILFVFLLTFLGAIFASQLFRGELPEQHSTGDTLQVNFATIFNSFLGMYQILSSENWTSILYDVTNYNHGYTTAWMGAIFFILWFTLAFFIVLNMFIAVIQENFDVSEDEKRLEQVKAFLQQKDIGGSAHGTLSLSAMFKLRTITGRRQDPLDYGGAMMEMLLKDAVVKDFLDDNLDSPKDVNDDAHVNGNRSPSLPPRPSYARSIWKRLKSFVWDREPNPFYDKYHFSRAHEELDPRAMAREAVNAAERRKIAQREYLVKHPTYNTSLFIFPSTNKIRRLCQKLVGPGHGRERVQGAAPSPWLWYGVSAFLYAVIVAMVLLACITTPLYQKQYWKTHSYGVDNWFVFTDLAFAAVFTVEALIRIIADGFFWTPNAYFRSSWGLIDGVVLITLWINCLSSLYNEGAVSRAVGAFKALRALRLLNVSDSARETFHSVIVRGGWKVLSAAFVSLSLLIPFAIWGLNIFNGRFQQCNDDGSGIFHLTDCVNEFMSSPNNWNVLAPRQVSNPWFSFDNFGASLFILFQVVSQEGWVDVMWSGQSATGFFTQPQAFATQFNAVFFVIFNLLGAVFVLTLFISVFMRNYTEQTGVAFLTTDQRSWLELRKILRQVSPSKRPGSNEKRQTWEQWCYLRAVRKTGRWQRGVTGVLVFHLVLLCLEFYPEPRWWEVTRDIVFFILTLFYICNIVIRVVGLTWTRFRKSSWDLYSILSIPGTFITTIMHFANRDERVYYQINKLFLVSVVLLLIPRNNQLDQLFKTAAASLTAIGNLLATWFVLFLVYAIAFTQTFGLTRFGDNESDNINFRDVPKALILLFRCSTGEGWDELMEDFASVQPPFCNSSSDFLSNDCGSPEWSRALFISWNILSMYIFVSMFVSLIYESFSYVYQRSSGLSVISRKEIRRFKQAWAEHDPDGTGYIFKDDFPRLLSELSGVFEMRIYPEEFTVSNLKMQALRPASYRTSVTNPLPIEDGTRSRKSTIIDADMDIDRLNLHLSHLPVDEIRTRRQRLNVFYEEVMVSADPDRGISFTTLLMILAHYKVINDSKSLRLEEYLRRRARLQRVEEAVRRGVVINFFDTIYYSRRFRKHMESKRAGRMTELPQLQVPEIFVEGDDDTPPGTAKSPKPSLSLQIPEGSSGHHGVAHSSATDLFDPPGGPFDHGAASSTPSAGGGGLRNRSDSIQLTPATATATPHRRSPSAAEQLTPSPGRGLRPLSLSPNNSAQDFGAGLAPRDGSPSPSSRRRSRSGGGSARHSYSRSRSGSRGMLGGDEITFAISEDDGGTTGVDEGMDIPPRHDGPSGGSRSRAASNVSARDVLQVFDDSAWGESLRRSYTTRRAGGGSSPGHSRGLSGLSVSGARPRERRPSRSSGTLHGRGPSGSSSAAGSSGAGSEGWRWGHERDRSAASGESGQGGLEKGDERNV